MQMRMRRSRSLLLSILVALQVAIPPLPLHADDTMVRPVLLKYNLNATSDIYCAITGAGAGTTTTSPIQGIGRIKTTGSSQTVSEFTASSAPFGPVAATDVLLVQSAPSTSDIRQIVSRASSAQVTVNPAVDWSASSTGYSFSYYHTVCGTGATAGAFDVSGLENAGVTVEVQQMTATAVLFRLECRKSYVGAMWNVVYPGDSSDCGHDATLATGYCSFGQAAVTAAVATTGRAAAQTVFIAESEGQCRVALKIDTDDGADTLTNAEFITIGLIGRVRK